MCRSTITLSEPLLFSWLPEAPAMYKLEPGGREISPRRADPPAVLFLPSLAHRFDPATGPLAYCHANAPPPPLRERVSRQGRSHRHRYLHSDLWCPCASRPLRRQRRNRKPVAPSLGRRCRSAATTPANGPPSGSRWVRWRWSWARERILQRQFVAVLRVR